MVKGKIMLPQYVMWHQCLLPLHTSVLAGGCVPDCSLYRLLKSWTEMRWGADARTTMVSVVHLCRDCKYLSFSSFLLIHTENSASTVISMISQNCQWQEKSTLCTSSSVWKRWLCVIDGSLVWLATPNCNLEWEGCAGIRLQELMGGNGYPSIHKFPPSSSPQICLAAGFTPQPYQRCTEAGWWHCFSGLGSPCPRLFITLALKINPVCTESY